MKIRYNTNNKIDELELSHVSDGNLFRAIANKLSNTFQVKWNNKLDGFDQRYWDFEFKGIALTLHLEHFLGISIFVEKTVSDNESAKQVLVEIGNYFKTCNPPN